MIFQVPGPCTVFYGDATTPADFGANGVTTQAGVTITSQMMWTPVQGDANGEMPMDWIFGGRNITVSFILNDIVAFLADFLPGNLGSMQGAGAGTIFGDNTTDRALRIVESTVTNIWQAGIAIPSDPAQLLLSSTQELHVPLEFKILPEADGALFNTLPSYLTAIQS